MKKKHFHFLNIINTVLVVVVQKNLYIYSKIVMIKRKTFIFNFKCHLFIYFFLNKMLVNKGSKRVKPFSCLNFKIRRNRVNNNNTMEKSRTNYFTMYLFDTIGLK